MLLSFRMTTLFMFINFQYKIGGKETIHKLVSLFINIRYIININLSATMCDCGQ